MLVKIHQAYRYVVAICDSNLIGKHFEEGKMVLDVKDSFFNGEEVDPDKLIKIIKDMTTEDATFNIVGAESVNTALECNLIKKEGIKYVGGVPFALVLL